MLLATDFRAPPLETVHDPLLEAKGVVLRVLRLDLVHPLVSGNKWYKLKLNLQDATQHSHDTVLSFGGAYSNHLVALAAAAKLAGLRSIGVVRGEILRPLNAALSFAQQQDMLLHAVSRSDYRRKHEAEFIEALQERYGRCYVVPEGGSNLLGVQGCAQIAQYLRFPSTVGDTLVAVACGTAATLAGIVSGLQGRHRVLGVSVLKGDDTLSAQVQSWLGALECQTDATWSITQEFHGGGYAKAKPELLAFIRRFHERTGIALEPVYTGKLLFALYTLIERGEIPAASEVIAIHTGGLLAAS